jgi:large subunit ribosomal protein L5
MANENPMRDIYLDKVVVNIGIGDNDNMFQNARLLLEKITGKKPVATLSKRRRPELGIRKGQIIGAMVTLRNDDARSMLKKALEANESVFKESCISNNSLSFGVKEYIYLQGVKYDPAIGMLGMNVNAAFARKGKRVESKRIRASKVSKKHGRINKEEIITFVEKNFGARVGSEE